MTGRYTSSHTADLLHLLGMPRGDAELSDALISTVFTLGGSSVLQGGRWGGRFAGVSGSGASAGRGGAVALAGAGRVAVALPAAEAYAGGAIRVAAATIDDAGASGIEFGGREASGESWQPGDDIHAPTRRGAPPSDRTAKRRFWKNEAENPSRGDYSAEDFERMRRGEPPRRYNPDKGGIESMEASHEPVPRREGGSEFVPRWPQDHAEVDPNRHPGY